MRLCRPVAWGLCLALVLTCLPARPAFAQKKMKGPHGKRILLLTGGQRQHHGYRDQALYLSNLLEDTGRYEVTLCEDAALLETPALAKYDLVIANADRRDPEFKLTESQQRALFGYVKSGHGYVSIHGADNAPPDWLPEWKQMLGGIYSHTGLPDGKTKKGTFIVKIVDTSSPVTRDLHDFELQDELYYHMQMLPEPQPLATIDYANGTWPVAWVRTYGSGRVFHTPLGHRDFGPGKYDPLTNPNLTKLVVQGIDWVADGLSKDNRGATKP